MKRIALICLASFLVAGCTQASSPKESPESTFQDTESQAAEPRNLTREEYDEIIRKAVEEEKYHALGYHYEDEQGDTPEPRMHSVFYKDGYYLNDNIYSQIYIHSSADYSTNHIISVFNGEETDHGEASSPEGNDPYVMTFGYAQFGFNPAAFIACYSGFGAEVKDVVLTGNKLDFTIDNFSGVDSMSLTGTAILNGDGGLAKLRYSTSNMPESQETGWAVTEFGERENPPQEIIDLFARHED